MNAAVLPTLGELGGDLVRVSRGRVVVSVVMPFVFTAGYFVFAFADRWLPAIACMVALGFATYGSVSHDLVHRSIGLPRRLNELLLTVIELLLLRSGRAYRLAHLNHHRNYPDQRDDPEAAAAGRPLWGALVSGPLFFLRLWWWAVKRFPAHRKRLVAEAGAALILATVAVVAACMGWSNVLLGYVLLAYAGTWVVPLATSYIPHTPAGDSPLSQTRRFRGWVARLVALDHLYHLEHHLYPAVPHQRWPELARRLDPYLDEAGVTIVRVGW